jgi:hypothetical protein
LLALCCFFVVFGACMLWNREDLPDDCVNREDLPDDCVNWEGSASHQSEDVKNRQEVN